MDVRELVERVLETVNGNQAELARRLGRSETTISRWVNSRTGIDYESALRIARMTGLPPRQVLEDAGLDPDLFPATPSTQPADAEFAARANEFQSALHDVPRRFWASVLTASIALAKAYGEAPTAETPPVSDPQVPPVSPPISPQTRGKSVPKRRLTSSQHHAQPIAAYA